MNELSVDFCRVLLNETWNVTGVTVRGYSALVKAVAFFIHSFLHSFIHVRAACESMILLA